MSELVGVVSFIPASGTYMQIVYTCTQVLHVHVYVYIVTTNRILFLGTSMKQCINTQCCEFDCCMLMSLQTKLLLFYSSNGTFINGEKLGV